MAFVQYKMFVKKANLALFVRHMSKSLTELPKESSIKKSVFISQSKDIFTNLALEDWLYRNFDFSHHHVLMLWQNDPCVVIGRHQNPWQEANVSNLKNITENGVSLARRNSGGGTVYHDSGNLNMTFFMPRECYNRKYNLEIITRAVFREVNLKINISEREDLMFRNSKVSGTASKLGRPNAYHHCTLLVDVNKVDLSFALQKPELEIVTNATKSIRSKVMNICEEIPNISMDRLITAVGWEYMRTPAYSIRDGGLELANKQKGFQMINPTDKWFPGIAELKHSFEDWNWCFGKTPKFTVSKSFPIVARFANNSISIPECAMATLVVENGLICDISVYFPPGLSSSGFTGDADVMTSLRGQRFTEEALTCLENAFGGSCNKYTGKFVESEEQAMTV